MKSVWTQAVLIPLVILSSACAWGSPVPAGDPFRLWVHRDDVPGRQPLAQRDRQGRSAAIGSPLPFAAVAVIAHARSRGIEFVPAIVPVGVANAIVPTHPDRVEGSPVKNVPMRVPADGTRARIDPGPVAFKDGGFEIFAGDSFTEWDWQDASGTRTFVDTSVAHSGLASARLEPHGQHARKVQRFAVEPWPLHPISTRIRTDSLTEDRPGLVVYGLARDVRYPPNVSLRSRRTLCVASTQDWTRFDRIVNSGDNPLRDSVWSDRLTPHPNAVDPYWQVKGSLVGSWVGLPPEVISDSVQLEDLARATRTHPWVTSRARTG